MKCKEVFEFIESWAPKGIAWQKDNPGLQLGSYNQNVSNVLLCLDVTSDVVDEAIKQKCNLIISHHPLFYHHLNRIDLDNDSRSRIIHNLIKNNISLYSAHTNLDFIKEGVSWQFANALDLKEIDFLENLATPQVKLNLFVPEKDVEKISDAVFEAGGGIIGDYSRCSFRLEGTGTFMGNDNTDPSVGEKNKFEKVNEIKLEVLVDKWNLGKVISEIKKVHPYEEPAFDVIPLENKNVNYGMGAVGYLDEEMNEREFLDYFSEKTGISDFKFTPAGKNIKKVAVCGGSGSDLINKALAIKSDVFITADISYHSYQIPDGNMLLIDGGHYETEILVLNELENRLKDFMKERAGVFSYSGSTNPVKFYNYKEQ